MRYEAIKNMRDADFKRLIGVKRHTFLHMVEVVTEAYDATRETKRGRKPRLSIEDMILLMLSYLRSYATFFETGANFGVSESWIVNTYLDKN